MSPSYFITPPDFVDNCNKNILLIDVADIYVQSIMQLCQTTLDSLNVYLYHCDMESNESYKAWINKAVELSDAIILDPTESDLSPLKNSLRKLNKTYVYGANVDCDDVNVLTLPTQYFTEELNVRK